MRNHWIQSTRLAALSLALLLSSCGGALAQADASPAAYTQSGTQGVSLTWTVENLCFDGQLLALDAPPPATRDMQPATMFWAITRILRRPMMSAQTG